VLVVSPSSITDRQDRNELAFKKILIPLDGSDRAEEVIPLTQKVAWLDDSEIILLYADWLQGMPKLKKGHVANKGEEYLATVGARLKKEGHQVTLKPVFGDAATAIHTFAEVEEIDLIAMTTHGRSGIPRWYYGSVAEKILRTSPCPVLVKRTVQREPRNMLPQTEEKAGRQAAAKQ
jgi:nucleotide-binding universal stress UspA family protein